MNNTQKSIYIGNLSQQITEPILQSVFQNFGSILSVHIIKDLHNRNDPYAFIQFEDPKSAAVAVASMNGIRVYEREIKVNWATGNAGDRAHAHNSNAHAHTQNSGSSEWTTQQQIAGGAHVFVGDIGADVTDELLREAFLPHGNVLTAKVIRFQDGRPRGFGFVAFENKIQAQTAITEMDKKWILNKQIRCNWATRSGSELGSGGGGGDATGSGGTGHPPAVKQYVAKPYNVVYNESPLSNTNVYVGGMATPTSTSVSGGAGGDDAIISSNSNHSSVVTEDLIRSHFEEFGGIEAVKVFPEKGFAFIRYADHESAARAISSRHGYSLNGQIIKCWWGKENYGPNANAAASAVGSNQAGVAQHHAAAAFPHNMAAAAAAMASAGHPPPPPPQLGGGAPAFPNQSEFYAAAAAAASQSDYAAMQQQMQQHYQNYYRDYFRNSYESLQHPPPTMQGNQHHHHHHHQQQQYQTNSNNNGGGSRGNASHHQHHQTRHNHHHSQQQHNQQQQRANHDFNPYGYQSAYR